MDVSIISGLDKHQSNSISIEIEKNDNDNNNKHRVCDKYA